MPLILILFLIILPNACIGKDLDLWITMPSTNQGTTCYTLDGTPLTDLASVRIDGWRFSDRDTITLGTFSAIGMEGDTTGVRLSITSGSMGELLVYNIDFANNVSCPAHYIFAVSLDTIPVAPTPTDSLTVEYYDNVDFTGLYDVVQDSLINKQWSGSPLPGMGEDSFSVRWTGRLRASETGSYRICDDICNGGFRFYLAGSLFSNLDVATNCGELCKPVGLTAGDTYDVIIEYWHTTGTARNSVRWITPSWVDQIIPPSAWR